MMDEMPYDAVLEAHVIHAFIANNNIKNMKNWASTIKEGDFFTESCKKAMSGVRICLNKNLNPDVEAIHATGVLTSDEFQTVLNVPPSTASMKQGIELLKHYSIKRSVLIEIFEVRSKIVNSTNPHEDVIAHLAQMKAISESSSTKELLSTRNTVRRTLQMFKDGATDNSDLRIFFHLDFMDKYLMAFRKEVVIIAGNSGMGKTSLGLSCVLPQVLAGKHIVYFCNESDETKLMAKLFSAYVGRSFTDLLLHVDTLKEHEARKLKEISELMVKHADQFHLYGAGTYEHSVSGIAMKANEIAEKYGQIDMLYVDYLQDMRQPSFHVGNEVASISYNIQGIKDLIQDLNCACVVFCQINRDAKNQTMPIMENLKGSSKIENIASIILFLHREKKADDREHEILPTLMYTPKTRDQKNIRVTIGFRGNCTRFETYFEPVEHQYKKQDQPPNYKKQYNNYK